MSQVYGGFDLASPSNIWDVMVLTHELGHNFGSPHTHCYSPPIDRCYNAEPGCYGGPVVELARHDHELLPPDSAALAERRPRSSAAR